MVTRQAITELLGILLPYCSQNGKYVFYAVMIVAGRLVVEEYCRSRRGHMGLRAAQRQFDAWFAEATNATWRSPLDVKASYAKASIVAGNRVVFNISGNRYRLVARINYPFGVIEIRFFGTHAEYDRIDVEKV